MHPVRCIINCSTEKLLLLRGRAKLPKRWKFAMKLRLISLTPFPLSLSLSLSLVRAIYLEPLSLARSPLLAAIPGFLSGGVTRRLSIAEESSTLQPFSPSLSCPSSVSLRDWTQWPRRNNIRCVKSTLTMKSEPDGEGELGGEEMKRAKTGE